MMTERTLEEPGNEVTLDHWVVSSRLRRARHRLVGWGALRSCEDSPEGDAVEVLSELVQV